MITHLSNFRRPHCEVFSLCSFFLFFSLIYVGCVKLWSCVLIVWKVWRERHVSIFMSFRWNQRGAHFFSMRHKTQQTTFLSYQRSCQWLLLHFKTKSYDTIYYHYCIICVYQLLCCVEGKLSLSC